MAINPDNFIFHSDFWYPTGYLSGTKEYVNVSIPATFTMSDQYEDGDFYSVWLEYPTLSTIGERYLSDAIINFTDGNELKVFKGAKLVGATFTGTLHWRIYKKNKVFNFLSNGTLEQTAKTLDGFVTAPGGVNSFFVEIPSGLTGKHFIRGTWQIEGQSANIIGGNSNNGDFSTYYDYANNKVAGYMTTYPGVLPAGTKIYYKIQLVPITQDSPYIFNSDKYSFAIPNSVDLVINDNATISAGATRTVYGEWVTLPGEKVAYDAAMKWSGAPTTSYQHYREIQLGTNLTAIMSVETSGNQIRPVLAVTNYSISAQSYSSQTFTYRIFMYQNNNSS